MYGLMSAKYGLSSAMYGLSSAMYDKMSAMYVHDKNYPQASRPPIVNFCRR